MTDEFSATTFVILLGPLAVPNDNNTHCNMCQTHALHLHDVPNQLSYSWELDGICSCTYIDVLGCMFAHNGIIANVDSN